MASVGEQLRNEREARNQTAAEIAAATGIDVALLEALERDDFHALPGKAFGKFYIRAYGEVLGFDPQPLIDSYDLEAERLLREGAPKPSPRVEASPRPVEAALARWRETKQAEREAPRSLADAERNLEEVGAQSDEDEFDDGVEGASEAGEDELEGVAANGATQADAEFEDAAAEQAEYTSATAAASIAVGSTRAGAKSHARARVFRPLVALAIAGLVLGTWIVYSHFSKAREDGATRLRAMATKPAPSSAIPPAQPQHAGPPPQLVAPIEMRATRPEVTPSPAPPSRSVKPDPASARRLVVSEYGVGRKIVNRRLEGQDDRFEIGQVVWFATRVRGARPGERIRHVWLHEGRVVHRIDLELGGPDWRTYSRATIRPAGEWAAEARDGEGHVLSRTTFAVEP